MKDEKTNRIRGQISFEERLLMDVAAGFFMS